MRSLIVSPSGAGNKPWCSSCSLFDSSFAAAGCREWSSRGSQAFIFSSPRSYPQQTLGSRLLLYFPRADDSPARCEPRWLTWWFGGSCRSFRPHFCSRFLWVAFQSPLGLPFLVILASATLCTAARTLHYFSLPFLQSLSASLVMGIRSFHFWALLGSQRVNDHWTQCLSRLR